MGQVSLEERDAARATLRRLNPRAPAHDVEIYLDAWATYREAQENIVANGAVCLAPKTGAPMSNPYLPVRRDAAAALRATGLRAGPLWGEPEAAPAEQEDA